MSMPVRICLSLFGDTEEILRDISSYTDADLLEIRLDLSPPLDLQRIRSATPRPLIFASAGRSDLLKQALPFADYADAGETAIAGEKSIVSVHAPDQDPQVLWDRLHGDHITKIVLDTSRYGTMSSLLRLDRLHPGRSLCFAMGEAGSFTRILAAFRGAPWIYSCPPGRPTAPGQFPIDQLTGLYRVKRFQQAPALFGIVGDPITHSLSPQFHNTRFASENLPWIYLPFPCWDLAALLDSADEFGILGLSITHPYKKEILPYLASKTEMVDVLESCNTVVRLNGAWHGANTDVDGIRATIEPFGEVDTAVIVGAGASAFAVAYVLRPNVRNLVILNRTPQKARALAKRFDADYGAPEDLHRFPHNLLFQTTPVGLQPDLCPVDPSHLVAGSIVIDAIYNPPETVLLQQARKMGCQTVNGKIWFETQAEMQFQIWKEAFGGGAVLP